MKKNLILICILCLSINSLYAFEPEWTNDKNRTPDKVETATFTSIDNVSFDHKYGNIEVKEGSSNDIQLEIRYFYGKKNTIPTCATRKNGKNLEIKTTESGKNNSKIDYIITIPKHVDMDVYIKYGNIQMNNFQGSFKSDMQYSNLTAGTFYQEVSIDGKYSNFTINSAPMLHLECGYSNLNAKKIEKLNIEARYSNFKLAEVGESNMELKYSPTTINKLGKALKAECEYSDISIKESSENLELVWIAGRYSNISLKLDSNISSTVEFETKYGSLNTSNHSVNYSISEKKNNSSCYKGTLGKGTPNADIKISTSYGNISIK